jgi:hypothetical protein
MADDDDDIDYGAPPHLSFDGEDDPRLIAMLEERLANADADPSNFLTTEELLESFRRRAGEWLGNGRSAA